MTKLQIINRVMSRLNLTSDAARDRITLEFDDRYREVISSCGLQTSASGTVSANTNTSTRYMTFMCEKIYSVWNPALQPPFTLVEYTFDQLRNATLGTDPAQGYAISTMGAGTVTIFLDCQPGSIYPLNADCELNVLDLQDGQEPYFPRDFHDILVHGCMADELLKMEHDQEYSVKLAQYEKRLSDLRYFLAKSAYLDIYQGATGQYNWPWQAPLVGE